MDIDQLEDSALFRANSCPEMIDLSSDDDVHSPRGGQDGALDPTHVDASTTHESTADAELNAAPQDHSNPKVYMCLWRFHHVGKPSYTNASPGSSLAGRHIC